jgi:adenylate kinase
MVKAIIFGAPGSGKGTYSSRLQAALGVDVISMGDIFRTMMKDNNILGRIIKSYVEAGLLVPDIIVNEVVREIIGSIPEKRGLILDGYPRTLAQAEMLDKITKIDVILQLVVPDWIIIERLSSRRICKNCGTVYNLRFLKPKVDSICDKCGGVLYQRPDDNPEVIQMRFDLYEKETSPLLRYYKEKKVPLIISKAKSLDNPPEKVVNCFVSELKKLKLT